MEMEGKRCESLNTEATREHSLAHLLGQRRRRLRAWGGPLERKGEKVEHNVCAEWDSCACLTRKGRSASLLRRHGHRYNRAFR
eukprot:g69055.t1